MSALKIFCVDGNWLTISLYWQTISNYTKVLQCLLSMKHNQCQDCTQTPWTQVSQVQKNMVCNLKLICDMWYVIYVPYVISELVFSVDAFFQTHICIQLTGLHKINAKLNLWNLKWLFILEVKGEHQPGIWMRKRIIGFDELIADFPSELVLLLDSIHPY